MEQEVKKLCLLPVLIFSTWSHIFNTVHSDVTIPAAGVDASSHSPDTCDLIQFRSSQFGYPTSWILYTPHYTATISCKEIYQYYSISFAVQYHSIMFRV